MDFPFYVPEGAQNFALFWLNKFPLDNAITRRLIYDDRMKEVYRLLTNAFFNDENQQRKIECFFEAALMAQDDYSKYRTVKSRADELRRGIAETADKLANMLNEIQEIGVTSPGEFFNVEDLLRSTNNYYEDHFDIPLWPLPEGFVMGDKIDTDPSEEPSDLFLCTYKLAPDVSAVIKTLSLTAKNFIPKQSKAIDAAICSRKSNAKTEYLRAFASILMNWRRMTITAGIMNAMAVTATVVINSPDVDVTYDDVRKALSALINRSEDSTPK